MKFESGIIARCMAISNSHFLNTPYRDLSVGERSRADGVENSTSGICHYCTIGTLKEVLTERCLRFTDVRFLNDSTEFLEVVRILEKVVKRGRYSSAFRNLILTEKVMEELKAYKQSYVSISDDTQEYQEYTCRTYTCSFSKNMDRLGMWTHYATTRAGVSICFDNACNMFDGLEDSEVNDMAKLKNGVRLYRGLVLYTEEDKVACVKKLIDDLYEVFKEIKDHETYDEWVRNALKKSINHMRCFFKSEHFANEEEYRVVLIIPEENIRSGEKGSGIKSRGFFRRENVLIPYIDYEFKKESVESVILNPYIKESDSMIELSIEELLWVNNYENVKVYHSSIPLKKYD